MRARQFRGLACTDAARRSRPRPEAALWLAAGASTVAPRRKSLLRGRLSSAPDRTLYDLVSAPHSQLPLSRILYEYCTVLRLNLLLLHIEPNSNSVK